MSSFSVAASTIICDNSDADFLAAPFFALTPFITPCATCSPISFFALLDGEWIPNVSFMPSNIPLANSLTLSFIQLPAPDIPFHKPSTTFFPTSVILFGNSFTPFITASFKLFAASIPLSFIFEANVITLSIALPNNVCIFPGSSDTKVTIEFTKFVPKSIALFFMSFTKDIVLLITFTKNVIILPGNWLINVIILLTKFVPNSIALFFISLANFIVFFTAFSNNVFIFPGKSFIKFTTLSKKFLPTVFALSFISFAKDIALPITVPIT